MIQFLPVQAGAFPADVAPSSEVAQRPVAVTAGATAEGRNTDFDVLSRLSPDVILLIVDGRLMQANPAAACLLDVQDPAQLAGLQLAGLIHPDDVTRVVPRLAGMVSSGVSAQSAEYRLVHADYTHVLVTSKAVACGHEGQPAVMPVLREAVSRHTSE